MLILLLCANFVNRDCPLLIQLYRTAYFPESSNARSGNFPPRAFIFNLQNFLYIIDNTYPSLRSDRRGYLAQ